MRKFRDFIPPSELIHQEGSVRLILRQCKLLLRDGEDTREFTFSRRQIRIGAMEDNDLVFNDETISRYHCLIIEVGHSYIIKDLHSTNGTFVEGVRVGEAFLAKGYTITLGNLDLLFHPVEEVVEIPPSSRESWEGLSGHHISMRQLYSTAERVAGSDAPILLLGETGTGRRTLAEGIHRCSPRAKKRFISLDCASFTAETGEGEFSGAEVESETGTILSKRGFFEAARGGTLYLHDLHLLPTRLQSHILSVIHTGEVLRRGAEWPIKVDVRIIAGTVPRASGILPELSALLGLMTLSIPPLRQRKEDIPILIKSILKKGLFNRNNKGELRVKTVIKAALERLARYDWPENVKELSLVLEQMVGNSQGEAVGPENLPPRLVEATREGPEDLEHLSFRDAKSQWVSSFEREYIVALLKRNGMNLSHAAREADMDRKYLRKLMKKYEITVEEVMGPGG